MDNQNHQSPDEMDARIYSEARSGNLLEHINLTSTQCLNFRTPQGEENVLHIACKHNHISIIKHARFSADELSSLLLTTNSVNETPFHTAVRYGHTETVKLLVEYFNQLAEQKNLEEGERSQPWWLRNSVDGDTVLHVAIRNGYQDIALYLMDAADPKLTTCVNKANESPLYLAAENRCYEILEAIMFLEGAVDYSVNGPNGRNPLHAAIKAASISACKLLIDKKPEFMKKRDDKDKTPLHLAVDYEQKEVVEKLLIKNTDAASIFDKDGLTPLLRAATKGHFHIIKTILARSPESATICDSKNRRNVIHLAENMSCRKLWKLLKLESMQSMINHKDNDGNTPLHLSIMNGDKDKAISLLEVQATNWRIKNDKDQTPMDLLNLKILERDSTTTQQEPAAEHEALITKTVSTSTQNLTSKQGNMTPVQMRLIQHAIVTRDSVLHPFALKSNWGPSYKRINLQQESLAKRKAEDLKKIMDGITLVATLIVTLTFAAAFQVPGGYNEETGSIVLIRKPSLKVFFYSDTIAMLLCIFIMLDYAWAFTTVHPQDLGNKVFGQTLALSVSLIFTIIAFISGLYAVVPPTHLWLMHTISVLTFIVMTLLVFLHPINLLFLRFPINLSFVRLPILFMGPLTYVGVAAFHDFRDQKASLSKHSSKKHD